MDVLLTRPDIALDALNTRWARIASCTIIFAVLDQILYKVSGGDAGIGYERLRLREAKRLNVNFAARGIVGALSALYFLVLTTGQTNLFRWYGAMHQEVVSSAAAPLVRFYFEAQVARAIWEMFIYETAGLVTMISGAIRAVHTMFPMLVMLSLGSRGDPVSVAHLAVVAQLDVVCALSDFKASGVLRALPSWVVATAWALVHLIAPAYALYRGYLGAVISRGAYAIVLFCQFLLWLALPSDKSNARFVPSPDRPSAARRRRPVRQD